MIAEKEHRARIIHRRVFSDKLVEKDGRHGRDVLMAEPEISARETGVAGLHRVHSDSTVASDHMPRKDFLGERHRALCGHNGW